MILNQGKDGACAVYALAGLLHREKWIDPSLVIGSLSPSIMTTVALYRKAKEKGLIEWFIFERSVIRIRNMLKRWKVLIARTGVWDFSQASKPPYNLVFKEDFDWKWLHFFILIGFDEKTQRFIAQNSWGDKWGDNGKFYILRKDFRKMSVYSVKI